ncbi:MAG: hypothetical protein M0T77_01315 [Actinomycetota bacterium]|nr:hypothetical protein [Actinomycetota bacterium]
MSAPSPPPLEVAAVLAALREHDVKYVLVGGFAARLHGAVRVTSDVDVCPAWDRDNLTRLASALRSLGATEKGTGIAPDAGLIYSMEITNWRTTAGDVDVLLGIPDKSRYEKAQYRQLHEQALAVQVGADTIEVAPLTAIIRSKEIADRPKDREALPELYQLADRGRQRPR